MSIDAVIEQIVEQKVAQLLAGRSETPELISIDEASKICGCDKSVINSLIRDDEEFPVIRLSPRVIKIDKHRLHLWLRNGGTRKKDQ